MGNRERMTTKPAHIQQATALPQFQTIRAAMVYIDALRLDVADAQNECEQLHIERKRLLAERAQLVTALRDLVACDDNAMVTDHAGPFGGALDPARALLRQIEGA